MAWVPIAITGVIDITKTLIDHSGDVKRVLGSVGDALKGIFSLDTNIPHDIAVQMVEIQERESFSQQLTRLGRKVEYLGRRLSEEARNLTGLNADSPNAVRETFVCLWRNPVGLTKEQRPSAPLYNQVSVMVSNLNMPKIYRHEGKLRDVIRDIASIIFEDIKPPSHGGEVLVKRTKTFEIEKGSSITVSHVYYIVDMGMPGEQYAIHSAIDISYTTPNETRLALAKVKERYNYVVALDSEDSWLVTLEIIWATAPTAENAQEGFQQYLQKNYSHMKVKASVINGVYQTVKIQAPLTVTPEQVRASVQAASQSNVDVPPSDNEDNQIPLTAQNVIAVNKTNETVIIGESSKARPSSWVDCVAER